MTSTRGRFVHSEGYSLEYDAVIPAELASPYLHILFHGATRIERYAPPVFARPQWQNSTKEACLFLCDPIHMHTRECNGGWFLLGEDEFIPQVLELRRQIMDRYGLTGTVWHGMSSGGYAALKYWMRAGKDDLAFVIAPHDDPTAFWQWKSYLGPYLSLRGMGDPTSTTRQMDDWLTADVNRYLHAVVSEKESYFALNHLRPILERASGSGARAVMLRNGRDHGFIADIDYETQMERAIRDWEAHSSRPATGWAPRPDDQDWPVQGQVKAAGGNR
jgi:hypothetical protein